MSVVPRVRNPGIGLASLGVWGPLGGRAWKAMLGTWTSFHRQWGATGAVHAVCSSGQGSEHTEENWRGEAERRSPCGELMQELGDGDGEAEGLGKCQEEGALGAGQVWGVMRAGGKSPE